MNTAVIFLCKDHRIIVHYVSRLLQIHCLKTGKKSLVATILKIANSSIDKMAED